MEGTERIVLENLCMLRDGSKVLVEDKITEDIRGIIFPGGHVEEHEPIVDSVIREMKEETGLTISNPHLVGIKQFPIENGRYIVLLFKSADYCGDLISSDEGKMEWVDVDKLSEVNVVEDLPELLKVMNDPNLNEFQYTIENGEWNIHTK